MGKNKYGYEKKFTRVLNGPYPFFVIRFHSPLDKTKKENAIRNELVKAAGDGFIEIRSYYFLLKISRLISKKLIPETAMFMDKYFDDFHCIIFCKWCYESVGQIFKVLEKGALGNYQWKLATFVYQYREVDLVYPKCISLLEMACPLAGHPSHDPSTSSGQLPQEKEDPDQDICSLLTGDEHTGGEESERAEAHELFLHRVNTTENDFEHDWELIEEALQKLYVCNPEEVDDMFNMRNTYIEEVRCRVAEMTRRHSDSQKRIHEHLEQSLVSHLIDICTSTDEYEGYAFLQEVYKNWKLFRSQVPRTMLLFQSVGPCWTTPMTLGLSLWGKYIISPGKLTTSMVNHIRTESDIEDDIVTELNEMVRLYSSEFQRFEMKFVGASGRYYDTSSEWVRSRCIYSICSPEFLNTPQVIHHWKEYFQYLDELLDDELRLAQSYLGATGQLLLLDAFHKHYFIKYNDWLKLCLRQSIDDNDYALLGRMHDLLSRLPKGPIQMKDMLVSHVEESFRLVRDGVHDDVVNGEHLLLLRHKYNQLISESLRNDKILEQAVNITFRKIANSDKVCAKYMSAYIDSRLRQTITAKIEHEIEEAFEFVVKYINGAAFKLFYWHYMADRMIKLRSSYKTEKHLIDMLTIQYGTDFTDKLEQMVLEMESQQQNSEGFNIIFPNECPSTSFMILDSRYWPIKQQQSFDLPLDVLPVIERFEAQHLHFGDHKKKKLWWQTHLGSATLIVTSSNGQRHELVVSTPQMSVLMLFNSADSLTYREIQERTRMADANLRPCLQSLLSVDGTSILTVKRHSENELCENDIFSINEKFNGQLDLSQKHEFEPERLVEIVDEAQKHHIEAAIARIMKSEKSLDHSNLVTAVTNALEPLFITTPAAVKTRIENLIEKELLEKVGDDFYRYV